MENYANKKSVFKFGSSSDGCKGNGVELIEKVNHVLTKLHQPRAIQRWHEQLKIGQFFFFQRPVRTISARCNTWLSKPFKIIQNSNKYFHCDRRKTETTLQNGILSLACNHYEKKIGSADLKAQQVQLVTSLFQGHFECFFYKNTNVKSSPIY